MFSLIPLVLIWALVLATVVRTTPHPEVGPQPAVDKSDDEITKDLKGYVSSALGIDLARWQGAWSYQLTFNQTLDTEAPNGLLDTLNAITTELETYKSYSLHGSATAEVIGAFDTSGYMSFAGELTQKDKLYNANQRGLWQVVRGGVTTAKNAWKSACQAIMSRMASDDPKHKQLHHGCLYIDGRLGVVEVAY
ncbi:hypothetical protein IE81DRAFT_350602 [Ceraceosorus guamensis]|uniref:Uncharacterized protein n=1 Tax=Ceraceosorus guamensis TaxID=1522189 RepID=A0A316VNR5_9BASI|nr:hypothetical protein IE81DRAFT_350602 [Ceraceosorus guamensis]PWN38954.1 hypothetical protein IE81DRAFT_350602 [Ceraceosorus guamensis]